MYGSWVPLIGKILYQKRLVVRCGYELLRNSVRDSIYSFQNLIRILFYFIMEIAAYGFADCTIMSCETDMLFINHRLRVATKNTVLIRNYIDTDNFSPVRNLNDEYLAGNSLLYIGRLIKRKNLESVLFALRGLDMELDIAGDGGLKDELMKKKGELNLNVTFLGIVANSVLPKLINRHPFVILPSFYENSPKALLEAMACGRVVICANVEGVKELIIDCKSGLLCETDSDSINRAIRKAMSLSVEERRQIGMNARQFVINECSIGKIYEKEKDVYDGMVCARKPRDAS